MLLGFGSLTESDDRPWSYPALRTHGRAVRSTFDGSGADSSVAGTFKELAWCGLYFFETRRLLQRAAFMLK